MIAFRCACGQGVQIDSKYAGKRCRCPYCQQVVVVPAVPPPSAEEPAQRSGFGSGRWTCAGCRGSNEELDVFCARCGLDRKGRAGAIEPSGLDGLPALGATPDVEADRSGAARVAVVCPKCNSQAEVAEERVGQIGKCLKCRSTIVVPGVRPIAWLGGLTDETFRLNSPVCESCGHTFSEGDHRYLRQFCPKGQVRTDVIFGNLDYLGSAAASLSRGVCPACSKGTNARVGVRARPAEPARATPPSDSWTCARCQGTSDELDVFCAQCGADRSGEVKSVEERWSDGLGAPLSGEDDHRTRPAPRSPIQSGTEPELGFAGRLPVASSHDRVTACRQWRCPGCNAVLEKGALGRVWLPGDDTRNVGGTGTCPACGRTFPQAEIYGGWYDYAGPPPGARTASCPGCGAGFQILPDYARPYVDCPRCGTRVSL